MHILMLTLIFNLRKICAFIKPYIFIRIFSIKYLYWFWTLVVESQKCYALVRTYIIV